VFSSKANYLGQPIPNLGQNTVPTASIPATFADGTSNTIVFAEKYAFCGPRSAGVSYYWGETGGLCNRVGGFGANGSVPGFYSAWNTIPQNRPSPANCNACLLQSPWSGGIIVGLGDGSVRNVSTSVSVTTWSAAVQPAEGVQLGNDW
jgi:hypothetical protein